MNSSNTSEASSEESKASVLEHLKKNNLQYLLVALLLSQFGLLDSFITTAQGVCF